MNPTPEQIAESEAEEREAEAFVDAQWKAADAWLAAEWPHASDETRAAVRSAWTELASRQQAPAWQPIKTAPRDGANILLAWGQDGVSQGHYVPGLQGTHPWKFIDTNDGITWIINHAVDGPAGPTHWMPMPKWARRASAGVAVAHGHPSRPNPSEAQE